MNSSSKYQRGVAVLLRCAIVISFLLAVTIGGSVDAQQAQGLKKGSAGSNQSQKKGMAQWWTNPTVQEELQLADEQIVAIGEVIAAHEKRLSELVTTERAAYRSLIQALDSENTSVEKIEERKAQLLAAWSERMVANIDKWMGLRKILSFEQWKALPEAAPTALRLGHLSVVSRGRIEVKDSTSK